MTQCLQALAILPKNQMHFSHSHWAAYNQPPVTPSLGIRCPLLASMGIPTYKAFTYKSTTVILQAQVSHEVGELIRNGDSRGEVAVR